MLQCGLKPGFAKFKIQTIKEIKVEKRFIRLKDQCIKKLMQVESNLSAIEETKWLFYYFIEDLKKINQQFGSYHNSGPIHKKFKFVHHNNMVATFFSNIKLIEPISKH